MNGTDPSTPEDVPDPAETPATGLHRPGDRLEKNLRADTGVVFLSGTKALVRLALMQRGRDAARGLSTQGFVSGYRGSPLGMVDQAIWKAGPAFTEAGIRFVPAINALRRGAGS